MVRIGRFDGEIAQTDVVAVRAGAVARDRGSGSIDRGQNPHQQLIGQKRLCRAAMHALQTLEVNQVAAGSAVKNLHV